MTRRVVVLDYGSGNIHSVRRALQRVGADVEVTDRPADAWDADGLVVPGVGAYTHCVNQLDAVGGRSIVTERVAAGRPVLGICVGLQILFDAGREHGILTKGLGLLPGEVTRLLAPRVPHMGWNTVTWQPGDPLFAGIEPDARCYFVHSYAARPTRALREAGATLATAVHGEVFVAAVSRGALSATQFHPEKSGDVGATLLSNWVSGL
ncbi:imidazole glycerol phosphate synthase subunit HisH [Actinocatenispora rupis]|uniref:Imidazole glycerol phosphate synthase subunit HisH n=1 Tax=Actinocatenispora rupis TaxID=519421 RepID=A0A8J3J0L1_9ACTN|nr:imidazole glycerol phosphate synthase subunit HisH [Actinocatenispora rupis]GID09316.1 imidazole glycerol phosphate synthase subunit HisH [Actinocatenispora rupis]